MDQSTNQNPNENDMNGKQIVDGMNPNGNPNEKQNVDGMNLNGNMNEKGTADQAQQTPPVKPELPEKKGKPSIFDGFYAFLGLGPKPTAPDSVVSGGKKNKGRSRAKKNKTKKNKTEKNKTEKNKKTAKKK